MDGTQKGYVKDALDQLRFAMLELTAIKSDLAVNGGQDTAQRLTKVMSARIESSIEYLECVRDGREFPKGPA
jgi:hypothetical protein